MAAFEIAFAYRNPVVVLGDGYLGQMTGRVSLPRPDGRPRPAGLGGVGRRAPTAAT